MATVLILVLVVALLAFVVSAVLAIVNRGDMAKRRRYNGWVLGSVAVAILSLVPFMLRWL